MGAPIESVTETRSDNSLIEAAAHVRFSPKADKKQIASLSPLSANRYHMHCSKRHR
jgi:hypothetical protein